MHQTNPNLAHRWGRVTAPVVDSFRRPIQNLASLSPAALNRNRQSQILRSDLPFRVLRKEKDCLLTETADHTFGWVAKSNVKFVPQKNYWKNVSQPKINALVRIPRPTEREILKAFSKFKRTPYLWGGRSTKGADCSGFVQTIFYILFQILLPKNSREQKKHGIRVKRPDICPLDLVFFVHRTRGTSHVGLAYAGKIWHLCLAQNKLVSEMLVDMSRNYRYVTARRLLTLPTTK